MKTVGIFADTYTASTGFAVVCRNLANELSRYFRVIYFGRFGQDNDFAKETKLPMGEFFEYVPCQGGVWDKELVVRILKHYDIDYVFTEDDWFSASGILEASLFWDKPFHLLTPIDSLPVHEQAFNDIFTYCDKIYTPNSSYELFNNKKRLMFAKSSNVRKRQGDRLKSVYLPHGADENLFYPKRVDRVDDFTFLWMGRIEERKAPYRALRAFEKIHSKMDARLYIRTDWKTPMGKGLYNYLMDKDLPVILDQTEDIPHAGMNDIYNFADVNLCTAKAGGFEMGVTEAALTGIPSIVSDWTFMNENVVDGKTGFLVPVEDFTHPPSNYNPYARQAIWGNISVDNLAEKMYWSYLNQEKIKSMGRWARHYVLEEYNWKEIGRKLKEEIKE